MNKLTKADIEALKNSLGMVVRLCTIMDGKFIFKEEVTFEAVLEKFFIQAKERGSLGFLKPHNDMEEFLKEAFTRYNNRNSVSYAIHPMTELPWANVPVDGIMLGDYEDSLEDDDDVELTARLLVYYKESADDEENLRICAVNANYDWVKEDVDFNLENVFNGNGLVKMVGWSEIPYDEVNTALKGLKPVKSMRELIADLIEE